MQISDDLIEYITRELLKRLTKGAAPGGTEAPKPLLHLVGRSSDLSTPGLARIQEIFTVREHLGWDDPLPPEASVLITALNIQALVRVAEGDEGCTVEGRALLAALLNGQPVAALKDGLVWRRYQTTAPKSLLARYAHCENILLGYGLKLVDEDGVAPALLGRRPPAPAAAPFIPAPAAPPKANQALGGRRIWTESDLQAACPAAKGPGQSLHLGPRDLLTPLAQDYALACKIHLIRS